MVEMEIVSPTRMQLLLKRREIKQVSGGIELLRDKRDVLLKEFFSTARPLLALRNQLESTANKAILSLILSLGFEGKEKLTSHSLLPLKDLEVEYIEKNLWGVRVPELKTEISIQKHEFGKIGESLHIDDTRQNFGRFIKLALKVLLEEVKLKRLGKEIKSTSRKVNFLKEYVLPIISNQIKYIQETIEEREHEDIFRLKRIKKKRT